MSDFPYPTSLKIANIRPTFANSKAYPLPRLVPALQRFPEDVVTNLEGGNTFAARPVAFNGSGRQANSHHRGQPRDLRPSRGY